MNHIQLPVIVVFVPFLDPNHLVSSEVTQSIYLRVFEISLFTWIYAMISLALIVLGEKRCYNTKTFECHCCEVLWAINLWILRDPSQPYDRGDVCITPRACGGLRVE
jgi:hypothetical protein